MPVWYEHKRLFKTFVIWLRDVFVLFLGQGFKSFGECRILKLLGCWGKEVPDNCFICKYGLSGAILLKKLLDMSFLLFFDEL